jgi:hypothetical protein
MSLNHCTVFPLLLVCVLTLAGVASAADWMTGAVVVELVEGAVVLEEVGADSAELEIVQLPQYTSGLLRLRTQADGAVFFRTSNSISVYNEGPGFFAVERFEQEVDARGEFDLTGEESGQSRMILHMREGLLVVDSRGLGDLSRVIVEVPLGRISVNKGWWMMQISQHERTKAYSFSLACADGVLRFTDRKGAKYTLSAGQRLSGVGSSERPSIAVAEISTEARSAFQRFSDLAATLATEELSAVALRAKMNPMVNVTKKVDPLLGTTRKTPAGKRPLIIEYAPQPPPVSESRGIICPPLADQTDLF